MQRFLKKQYKTLRVVYNNCMATYDDLLALDNKLKIHQTHLQFLANEIYQPRHELNRSFMWKAYEERNIPYSLTRGVPRLVSDGNAQKHGMNLLQLRGSIPCKTKQQI